DMKDVLMLRKYIAHLGACTDEAAADMNGDGSLDMKDVLLLRLLIVRGSLPEDTSDIEMNATLTQVMALINQCRAAEGLSSLKPQAKLQQAANVRALELKESYSHTRPNGESCFTAAKEAGVTYTFISENIARGPDTPEAVVELWMASESHRANLLDPQFTHAAVGFEPETNSWVLLVVTSPDSAPPSDADANTAIAQVIALVNQRRAEAGLPALKPNTRLQEAAQIRALELRELFSHTRPNGEACFTVFEQLGIDYAYVGENIAYGYMTPEAVMEGWMNSEGHRKNILDPSFTDIAVGYDPEGKGWVQLFLTPPA
ncbi:MAG: hypothetical protein IKI63_03160, partial [Clostridia bacterium]|nr:hypothetical protein [Clostridia bacterium]